MDICRLDVGVVSCAAVWFCECGESRCPVCCDATLVEPEVKGSVFERMILSRIKGQRHRNGDIKDSRPNVEMGCSSKRMSVVKCFCVRDCSNVVGIYSECGNSYFSQRACQFEDIGCNMFVLLSVSRCCSMALLILFQVYVCCNG